MRESSPSHYIGLDIGTSTVRCVIGILEEGNKLSVIGQGSAPNLGMRKGAVVHVEEVTEAVVQAVTEAERLSGVQVQQATVNVNGSHVAGANSRGVIAISTANREITPEDRLRVEEAANQEVGFLGSTMMRAPGEALQVRVGRHGAHVVGVWPHCERRERR